MIKEKTFYPSIFRVAIGTLLLLDIFFSLLYNQALYKQIEFYHIWDDYLPFLVYLREYIYLFLLAYLSSLICWIMGIGKHLLSLIVYVFFILDFLLLAPAVFWGDFVLRITLLFFVFVDSFHFFSIRTEKDKPGIIHKLAVLSIMINLCLVYLDNAYFKLQNLEWVSGYAIGYFFQYSMPFDVFGIGNLMMKSSYLIQFATWSVLGYQLTFPFVIWLKKLKWWWIGAGILIHLLMAVTLQLYKFELIIILLYGFFITDTEWQSIFNRLNIKLEIIHGER